MPLIDAAKRFVGSWYTGDSAFRAFQINAVRATSAPIAPRELYALLRRYYASNGLYEALAVGLLRAGLNDPLLKGMRNPAFRVVEFYVASIWPGTLPEALPIEAENERLEEPIRRVWTWSNWGQKKQVFARELPMLGDCFVKVASSVNGKRVYFQMLDPAHVTAFDTDERGYLTYCRIDTPTAEDGGRWTRTEVWEKASQAVRFYRHQRPDDAPESDLGPADVHGFSEYGVDFVPIVHCKFRDVGEDRGVGAFTLQIDKIDEANRKATRLAQQLYRHNDVTWAIEGQGQDREGARLPPLKVREDGTVTDGQEVQLGGDRMLSLPGGYTLKSLVPDIDFEDSLKVLLADMAELQQDLPEMAYWRVTELGTGDLSGRALRFLLSPAISRAEEARGNAEDALARLDAMALTIGDYLRLPGFEGLGSYDAGDFEHRFKPRDVVPLSALEEAELDEISWRTAGLQREAGVSSEQILAERDYEPEDVTRMLQENEARRASIGARAMEMFDRGREPAE